MRPGVLELLRDWSFDPALAGSLALAAVVYLGGVRRAPGWPLRRTAAFLAGLAAAALALQSGIELWSARLLSIHMAQHLLLTLVAPPLLCAGAPLVLALRASRGGSRRALGRALASRTARLLGQPAVGIAALAAVTLVTHLTPLYEAALRHEAVHATEHVLYLGAGLLFWMPLIGREPGRARLGPTGRLVHPILAMPAMAAIGAVLEAASSPLYSSYVAPARELGLSALADQRLAGALMWVGGTIVLVPVALAATWAALRAEERRAIAREAHAERLEAVPR